MTTIGVNTIERGHPTPNGNALAPTRILLVDDDEDIRHNAMLILNLEHYDVHTATNGQEALDVLTREVFKPHLIISDIAMPKLDGYALLQAVRQMQTLKFIPFIFLTAHGSNRHIRFGRELGVDDYLTKPFDPGDLLAAVRNKLGRTQQIRDFVEGEFDTARRVLVQMLSHELRTPLTYITGGFELLADTIAQANMGQDANVSIGLIRSGTTRLTRLAEQVVRYAELTSGHGRLQLQKLGEVTHPGYIVELAAARVKPEADARNINLHLDNALADDVYIFGVVELLVDAVYEVLRNATTFSPEGGTIVIGLHQEEAIISLTISDTGRGIPEKDQPTIWDVMTQSERGKYEHQGVGMGLPIVKQTLLLHNGDAHLQSTLGEGTTITLRLPITDGTTGENLQFN